MDAWKREHSDFPTLKSGSNKSGWVAGLCFLFRPPMGQAGLRTLSLSASRRPHRQGHPSLGLLAPSGGSFSDGAGRVLLVGGFLFVSEPGAGGYIR